MCKHIKFDANCWGPCKVCLMAKRAKNKDMWIAQIAEFTKQAEEIEAQGKKATYERDEIRILQTYLAEI